MIYINLSEAFWGTSSAGIPFMPVLGATDNEDHQIFILQHSTPQTTENRY